VSHVADANVVVKWFVDEEGSDDARELLTRVGDLFAPTHALAEIGHVLVRQRRAGKVRPGQFDEIKAVVPKILSLVPVERLFARGLDIAWATGLTVYDSLYVATAEDRSCRLVTADEKLLSRLVGTEWSGLAILLGRSRAEPHVSE
jgi:predicted nucleic acid-binding protein